MTKQIEYFSELKDQMSTRLSSDRASAMLSKSIFLISAGANDAFDFFSQNRSPDSTALQQFCEAVISTYDSHVKTLYNLGARKFAVINVPLIGCCPYWRSQNPTGECVEPLNQLAKRLNDGIQDLFSDLSSQMQGMKYSIASSYALVSNLIENPHAAGKLQQLSKSIHRQFAVLVLSMKCGHLFFWQSATLVTLLDAGFTEVKSACCGGGKFNAEQGCTTNSSYCSDRGKFLFWDLMHPTQATSKLAGLAFYDGPARFVGPITFRQIGRLICAVWRNPLRVAEPGLEQDPGQK